MTAFIILTAEQASSVRGGNEMGAALNPRATAQGDFALGLQVLDDPLHAEKREVLVGLPRREIGPDGWPEEAD